MPLLPSPSLNRVFIFYFFPSLLGGRLRPRSNSSPASQAAGGSIAHRLPAHRLRVLQLRPPGSPPPRVALVLWPLADPVRLPGQLRPSPCRSTPISSKLPGGRCSAACAPAGPQAVRPHSALQSTTDASIWVCKSEGERMCTSWTRRTDAATSYMCCLNWNLDSLVSESCQFHVPVKYVSAARWCELCRATTVLCTLC